MADQALPETERLRLMREYLFQPCETKEHLHAWVKVYLGLDLPSTTVCHTDHDHEPSNSNPLDLLWEVYDAARQGDRSKFYFLYYAARGCYKSVIASVIEALCLFHLRRDVGHMAANKKQSKIVQDYLAQYLKRPVLRDFMTSKNQSEIAVTWYECGDARLSPAEYQTAREIQPASVQGFVEKSYQVTVIVATLGGANGLHVSLMVCDELDLTSEEIISEAMMIPAPGKENGEHPMVLMTSSRKFAFGPVQNAIDNAHRTGLLVRHWNVIDVTGSCPPERHRPDLPRLKVYVDETTLTTMREPEYNALSDEERGHLREDQAYAGCVENCKIFAMCRGRLATEQKCQTNLLREVDFTQKLFQLMTDVEKAQAQLLCWKPSRAGMVYPRLNRAQHVLTAAQIVELVTGEVAPRVRTRADLVAFFKTLDVTYGVGVDHGHNHCFAGVLGIRWANTLFIIDAFEVPGLETDGKVRILESRFKAFDPVVWPDTSHPGDNKTIARHGFRVRKWVKGPGSVVDGIGVVRMKLNPVLASRPELYFLAGEPGVEALFERLSKYSWIIDPSTGEPTDEPNEKDDDGPDAFRYLVMNMFAPGGRGIRLDAERPAEPVAPVQQTPRQVQEHHWNMLVEHAGADADAVPGQSKGRKGSFIWNLE